MLFLRKHPHKHAFRSNTPCIHKTYRQHQENPPEVSSRLSGGTNKSQSAETVQDGIYNVAVFWPEALNVLVNRAMNAHSAKILPTLHAKNRISEYGLPETCYQEMLAGTIVEASVTDVIVTKIVTRRHGTESLDWCAVIRFEKRKSVIITMWCNCKFDRHRTLKRDKYVHM